MQKACPANAEVDETLVRVLRTLDETARAGVFAPWPTRCDFCDFESVAGGRGSRGPGARRATPALPRSWSCGRSREHAASRPTRPSATA